MITPKLILLCVSHIWCTIDLNLPELQYLADHLHSEECRKLVASLHFKTFEKPNALDQAEQKVSKDVPCIRLLMHWNNENGEGRGETHEIVGHRLRQIGRQDLADWLGKTVYHELGIELERSLKNPFGDILSSTEEAEEKVKQPTFLPDLSNWDPTEWIAFDTICWVFVIGLAFVTLLVLGKVICMLRIKKKSSPDRKKRFFSKKKYDELNDESNSESEDKFDIRNHEIIGTSNKDRSSTTRSYLP